MRSGIRTVLLQILAVSTLGAAPAGGAATLGSNSCSTSGCHGGAGDHHDEYVTWSQRDVHSRSYATLTTARAARMAEALSIASPSTSPRCIICHAPLEGIDPASLGAGVDPSEGVSCVSCHDLPAGWLRSHTRQDWTHADRVAAGMRDLNDLYGRANTCVACHQNVDPALVSVGHHPALIFEMDGQTQDEPRHWKEVPPNVGAQAWFVGQAVALREVSWALLNGKADAGRSAPAWQGLVWLLSRSGLDYHLAPIDSAAPSATVLATSVETSDTLAKRAAQSWDPASAGIVLRRLAATRTDFLAPGTPQLVQACRAERLVLALDRLLAAVPASERPPAASSELDRLFQLAQSQPDFAPAEFAGELARFDAALGVSAPLPGPRPGE
jgi:hypothetical protein